MNGGEVPWLVVLFVIALVSVLPGKKKSKFEALGELIQELLFSWVGK